MIRFFYVAVSILLAPVLSWAMPHRSAVCESLLEAGDAVDRPQLISAENTGAVQLPFPAEVAPKPKRYREIESDLKIQQPGDRIFLFTAEDGEDSARLIAISLAHMHSLGVQMRYGVTIHHFKSLMLIVSPFSAWFKQLVGIPLRKKERQFLGGWAGLAALMKGVFLFSYKNPFITADRFFLYKVAQEDRAIIGELERMRSRLTYSYPNPAHHMSRDFILTEHLWKSSIAGSQEFLVVDAYDQILADTAPTLERLFRFLFSAFISKKEKLQVKMDLMSNIDDGKSILLVRTRPLN